MSVRFTELTLKWAHALLSARFTERTLYQAHALLTVSKLVILFFPRLSKAEQEQQQTVVKAEIVTYPQHRMTSNPQSNAVKTAICSLQ